MDDPTHAAIIFPHYMTTLKSYISDDSHVINFKQATKFIYECATAYDFILNANGKFSNSC